MEDKKRSEILKQHKNAEAPPETAPAASDEEGLSRDLEAAEQEAKEHYEKLLRMMAEFENFKRRSHKDLEERVRYGNERLLADLLPTLDDLDRVIDHLPTDIANEGFTTFVEGVKLLRRNVLAVLEKYGLHEVAALGKSFDPACHEAIAAVPGEASSLEQVVEVHRKGYWLGERLLRPSLVTVARPADGASS